MQHIRQRRQYHLDVAFSGLVTEGEAHRAVASAGLQPMARSTWVGSGEPDLQAEPEEKAIPRWSMATTMLSPRRSGSVRLRTLGRRASAEPLSRALGMRAHTPVSRRSRRFCNVPVSCRGTTAPGRPRCPETDDAGHVLGTGAAGVPPRIRRG